MKTFTVNTKFKDIFEDPMFRGYTHMLDYRRCNPDKTLYEKTPLEVQKQLGWSADRIAEGFSYLYERAEKEQVFYSFRSKEEKAENPDKATTGIAAFPAKKKSRTVIICPGGGYSAVCTMLEGYPLAKQLNELGYSAFIVNYRVGKAGRQQAPLEDLAKAVDFILKNADRFNADPDKYCVIGFSAGAHLVSSWGVGEIGYRKYSLPKPSLLVLGYPVITMGEFSHEGSKNNLLGEENTNNDELIRKYSTELNITGDYPPSFVWQCDGDPMVPLENSILMTMSLRKNKVPSVYEVYHYPTHGLHDDADQYAKDWYKRAMRFWEEII